MSSGSGWRALSGPVHRRFPVRWSTLVMLVAFVGLGYLYLVVRTTPVAQIPVSVSVSPTTSTTAKPVEHHATSTTGPTTTTSRATTSTTSPSGTTGSSQLGATSSTAVATSTTATASTSTTTP